MRLRANTRTNKAPKKPKLKELVEQEIKDHPKWCGKDCQTFLETCYRMHRIERKHSAKEVQSNYDWCHIFR